MKIDMENCEWRKIIDLLIDDSLNSEKIDVVENYNEFKDRVDIIDKLVTKFAGGG